MTLFPNMVTACLVTRGDVDMQPIIRPLLDAGIGEIVVWDNSVREDLGIYGRYAAIREASSSVIFTQDDDLTVSCLAELCDEYENGKLLVNYPQPYDIPWVARGALFHRDLPERAFRRWDRLFPRDHDFTHWQCDGVFGLLSEVKNVDFGSEDLAYCNDSHRISAQGPEWYERKRPVIAVRVGEVLAA